MRELPRRSSAPGRSLAKAAIALPQVVSRVPVRPLEWITRPADREQVAFDAGPERVCADVYRPRGPGQHPGIVMALGVNELGGRDPRAVTLADGLARSGFVVLVMAGANPRSDPDANDLTDLARAPAKVAAAFEYLVRRADVDDTRVGLVGVCIGSGVCLLTAIQPSLARRVAFVFLIGPYYSLRS
ncbi:MAG TPA: dienelactone hydrolase family protein, partial [Chloroflexota bacterium]